MKTLSKRGYTVAVLLLFVSLFSLSPTLTRADQQSRSGTAAIDLSGQAMPFDGGNGTLTPALLSLAGIVQRIGDSEIKMQNLTGALQIGSTNYTVSNGQGDANKRGEIVIVADTSSTEDDHQLVLNGSIKGNTLAFDAPSSRLASQFFLALMGSIKMNDQGSSIIANTSLSTSQSNETLQENNTSSASSTTATLAINLSGQATPVENANGTATPAMLNLIGTVERESNGEQKLQNLTGFLQIGAANYSISTGHGDSNKHGEFVIFGETSSGELVLHGTIQNNSTMTVDSSSSRLSSLAYLALSGTMAVNNTETGSAMTISSSQNVTSTSEIENKTSTTTSANTTSKVSQQSVSSNSLVTANVTSQFSTNATENAVLTGDSTMITSLNNQTTANALLEQTSITATTTQPGNQTITVYVTQTVANSTVTHVTNAPNATITQTSVTTVANVTVTVTNSTTSWP